MLASVRARFFHQHSPWPKELLGDNTRTQFRIVVLGQLEGRVEVRPLGSLSSLIAEGHREPVPVQRDHLPSLLWPLPSVC